MTQLRSLPASFRQTVVAAIDDRLDAVEASERCRILLAVESGSRAWGFPSPDSDHDCRFIYVRDRDDYCTPWPRRDVIETPLDAVLDVNGWDLGKALKLMLKGNAVIGEWLASPIVYRGDNRFCREMLAFAQTYADRDAIARHYLHLGERQQRTYFADEKQVELKKLFYALRPAMALRWLRLHPDARIPPMHFPTLVSQSTPEPALAETVDRLLAAKAVTHELGIGPLPPVVRDFVTDEFARAAMIFTASPRRLSSAMRADAEALFRRWLPTLPTRPSSLQ